MGMRTRAMSIAAAGALVGGLLVAGPGGIAPAGAATATYTCTGIKGDVAGKVAGSNVSSFEILELLGSIGSSSSLSLPIEVTSNAPASVKTGSGPFDAKFDFKVQMPQTLVDTAKDLLGVTKFDVKNATFGIDYSGAATGTLSSTTPALTVNLNTTPVIINQSVSGQIEPEESGLIQYRPGTAKLSIVVGASVAGAAEIGTLTVQCSASGVLGSTSVKPPGSPNINPNPISQEIQAGETGTITLDDNYITPDEGNPVLFDTLKIVEEPTAGSASLNGNVLSYTAPAENGTYPLTIEVCGASRVVEGTDGANEIQTMGFADRHYLNHNVWDDGTLYPARSLRTHPLFFTLEYDGQETRGIPTSFVRDPFGTLIPVNVNNPDVGLHAILGEFRIPSAATIQAALEGLPNVEPGDIKVSLGPALVNDLSQPYVFEFDGNLGRADVPQITVGEWNTWAPNSALSQILDAASGLGGGEGGDGGDGGDDPAPPTYDQALQMVLNGEISPDRMLELWGERIQYDLLAGLDIPALLDAVTALFPKTPEVATLSAGEVPIPDSDTGLLCSQGVVQFVVTGGVDVLGETETAPGATPVGANPSVVG